jgi:hypothetical protein
VFVRLRIAVTLAIAATAAVGTACNGGGSGSNPPASPEQPEQGIAPRDDGPSGTPVARVVIRPATIHATSGASFEMEAIASDVTGTPIGDPGAIQWTGSVTFSNATANPTIVTTGATGPQSVTATIGGVSGTATVHVAPSTPSSDRLTLPHVPGAPISAVLIDANEFSTTSSNTSATCTHDDLQFGIAGTGSLGRNLTKGCVSKLAVFAPGQAVRFECHRDASHPNCAQSLLNLWSNGRDDVARTALPPLTVELVMWFRVSAETADVEFVAKVAANYATAIYSDERAAMTFDIATSAGGANGSVRVLAPPEGALDPCVGVESALDFTPVKGRVNVVYAEDIQLNDGPRAITCDRTAGEPPIVVIRYGAEAPTTLAHELGHVMGLVRNAFDDWRGGHTWQLPGFDETNLMWSETNATVGLERDRISLGQAFRMHVDTRSWVNTIPDGSTVSIRKGDTETCQTSRDTSTPCPVLRTNLTP